MANSAPKDKGIAESPATKPPRQRPAGDWGETDANAGAEMVRRVAAPDLDTGLSWGTYADKDPSSGAVTRKPLAFEQDQSFFRTALHYIGGTTILAILGALALAFADKEVPQFLVAIGSGALGLFGAMFGSSKR